METYIQHQERSLKAAIYLEVQQHLYKSLANLGIAGMPGIDIVLRKHVEHNELCRNPSIATSTRISYLVYPLSRSYPRYPRCVLWSPLPHISCSRSGDVPYRILPETQLIPPNRPQGGSATITVSPSIELAALSTFFSPIFPREQAHVLPCSGTKRSGAQSPSQQQDHCLIIYQTNPWTACAFF